MLECVQALVDTLDSRCSENRGLAVVDIYTMMSNLTSVGQGILGYYQYQITQQRARM